MGFKYVEPTVAELNARIAGGKVFVQSDLSGTYTEKYYDPLPIEIQASLNQPVVSWEGYQAAAAASIPAAAVAYEAMKTGDPVGQSGITPLYSTPIGGDTQAPDDSLLQSTRTMVTGGALDIQDPTQSLLSEWISGKRMVSGDTPIPTEKELVEFGIPLLAVPSIAGAAGLIKTAAGVGSKTGAIAEVGTGIATGMSGGGWTAAITAGLGLLGLSGSAATLLGLAGTLIPGVGEFLTGGGGGTVPAAGTGGTMGYETSTGSTAVGVTSGRSVGGVPFGGIGVPEPPAGMVSKAWKTKSFSNTAGEYWVYHWLLLDGRRLTWNAAKRQAKIWRPTHNITLGPKPRVKDLIRINRKVNTLNKHVKKQLKRAGVEL